MLASKNRYTKPIVQTLLINNSIRAERAENRSGELGQRVRSNESQLFESCPRNYKSFISHFCILRALLGNVI